MTASDTPSLPCPVAPLVPHARGMCLLTQLVEVREEGATAETVTRRDDLFAEPDGIPAWVGVEWLAQAVAAWAGFRVVASGEAPAPGLLLGAKRYRARVPVFDFDQRIRVTVTIDFVADNGVTQVSGALYAIEKHAIEKYDIGKHATAVPADAEPLARGSLTLYRPAAMPALNGA